jgi:hypothetical protein
MSKLSNATPLSRALAGLGLLGAALSTAAAEPPFPPARALICTPASIVDKDKLVDYLVAKYPLSVLAFRQQDGDAVQPLRARLAALLGDPKSCEKGCAAQDAGYLRAINGNLALLLAKQSQPWYRPTADVSPADYLAGKNEDAAIACGVPEDGLAAEAPGAVLPPKKDGGPASRLRVRGDPGDLYIDQASADDFSASSKATLSYARDELADSRTIKSTAYIGYPIALSAGSGDKLAQAVVYVGWDRNVARKGGAIVTDKSTDLAQVGLLYSNFIFGSGLNPMGHRINIRPDYVADRFNGSRLIELQAEYIPTINGKLNDFIGLNPGRSLLLKPMLALRSTNGHYKRRSDTPTDDPQENFSRLGGEVGFALISKSIPVSFTSTYTGLRAVRGTGKVSYFKHSLNYNFDDSQFFGVTLDYSRGTRADNLEAERKWELAFSFRY